MLARTLPPAEAYELFERERQYFLNQQDAEAFHLAIQLGPSVGEGPSDHTPMGLFRMKLLQEEFYLLLHVERDQWAITRYLWFDCTVEERRPFRLLAKRIKTHGWAAFQFLPLPRHLRIRVPPPICAPQYLHCLYDMSLRRCLSMVPGTMWQVELQVFLGHARACRVGAAMRDSSSTSSGWID